MARQCSTILWIRCNLLRGLDHFSVIFTSLTSILGDTKKSYSEKPVVLDQRTHGSRVWPDPPLPAAFPFSHQNHEHCPLDLVASQPRGQMLLCFGGHCTALAPQCRELTSCASRASCRHARPPTLGSRSLQREGLPAHLHNAAGTVQRGQSGVSLGPPTSPASLETALLIDSNPS